MSYTVRKSSMKIQTSSGEKIIPGILTESREASLTAITNARTSAVSAIGTAKTEATDAIAAKGAEVLASIPEDYTDLIEDVEANTSGYASLLSDLNSEKKKVKTLEKTVENLTKAAQGTIYDDITDDRTLHSKTLGDAEICGSNTTVLPNGELLSVGGRTVVWNQLIKNGNFADNSVWAWGSLSTNGISTSVSGNKAILTVSVSDYPLAVSLSQHGFNGIAGHKYYTSCVAKCSSATTKTFVTFAGSSSSGADVSLSAGVERKISGIITATESNTNTSWRIYLDYSTRHNIGDVFEVSNVIVVDLTVMFGSGSEPATVDAFEAYFDTSVYHPYCAGTLMSLPTKQVNVDGVNLLDAVFEAKKYIHSVTGEVGFSDDWSCTVEYIPIRPNTTYSLTGFYHTGTIAVQGFYDKNKNYISGTTEFTFTTPSNAKYARFSTKEEVPTAVQLQYGSVAYPYKPPKCRSTLVIPQSVKALTGYGWSAGSVCNEVDWSAKTYTQRVGKVDLGTLTWTYKSDYTVFSTGIPSGMVPAPDWTHYTNATCGKYSFGTQKNVVNESVAGIAVGASNIFVRDAAYTDAAAFKTAMSGVMLYYELAEPIVTDISDILPDNLLSNLETGGTITFVADGVDPSGTTVLTSDEQSIPVPNSIAYQTKIAS